ncbi:MAG: hypothetical protein K0Q79_984 [Flavipsychrobacter sp.]|jgi:hypothetical protein|nr:hypothetical protein [Flavipsychrobacter sp.]
MDTGIINKIVSFINGIGIDCREGAISATTFLPGIEIQNGSIVYDVQLMKYPGDLLHEAGHLAVLLPADRHKVFGDNPTGDICAPAAEMAAIAWSWAALQHVQIPPHTVFHEHGYKGGSQSIIDNFSEGKYIAVPMLQWLGMTTEPKHEVPADEYTYPKMKHWLRGK